MLACYHTPLWSHNSVFFTHKCYCWRRKRFTENIFRDNCNASAAFILRMIQFRAYFITPIHSFCLSLLHILSLTVVLYGCLSCITGFGEMKYFEREQEAGRKAQWCVDWSSIEVCVFCSLRGNLLAFTLDCARWDKHTPAHT